MQAGGAQQEQRRGGRAASGMGEGQGKSCFLEGEPEREVGQRTGARQCSSRRSLLSWHLPSFCTCAGWAAATCVRCAGGRHHLDEQPTAGGPRALRGHFPLAFPGSRQEWGSPHGEAWLHGAGHRAGEARGRPGQLASLRGLLYQLSFLLWGFFFFHLRSTLSFPSANVKGHQEALDLRRSAKKRLLWAEWATPVTGEEAVRTEDAASAREVGSGYSDCLA